jgi:hypothetical protein
VEIQSSITKQYDWHDRQKNAKISRNVTNSTDTVNENQRLSAKVLVRPTSTYAEGRAQQLSSPSTESRDHTARLQQITATDPYTGDQRNEVQSSLLTKKVGIHKAQ